MNGFISLALTSFDGRPVKRCSGFNSFQQDGILNLINGLIGNAGSLGTMALNTAYLAPQNQKVSMAGQDVDMKAVFVGGTTYDSTYFKRYTTATWAIGTNPGCYLGMSFYGSGNLRIAGRLIGGTTIGRVFGHSIHTPATRAAINFFDDAGYSGSSDTDSAPVIGGSYTGQSCGAYVARIRTGGAPGTATYDLAYFPCRFGIGTAPYGDASVAYAKTTTTPYDKKIKFAADDTRWLLDHLQVSCAQGSFVGEWDTNLLVATLASPPDDNSPACATIDPSNSSVCWAAYKRTSTWCRLYKFTYSRAGLPPTVSLSDTHTYITIGFSMASTVNFTSVLVHPTTGVVYLGTSAGVFALDGATWTQLGGALATAAILYDGLALASDGNTLYAATTTTIYKYSISGGTVTTTFTTGTTPALKANIADTSTDGKILVDNADDLWIAYGSSGNGVSRLNAAGDTITNWNASNYTVGAANKSGLSTKINALYSDTLKGLGKDNYGRILCSASRYIQVFERGYWSFFGNTSSSVPGGLAISPIDNAVVSVYLTAAYYAAVPVFFGWNGSAWVEGNTGAKTTHTDAQGILDGMTIQFVAAKNYAADDWFSWAASKGIVKDNLQELTMRYGYYTAELVYEATEGGTVPATPFSCVLAKAPTGASADPNFLICEVLEKDNWTINIAGNGGPATLLVTEPTQTNEVQVSDNGTLTFHSGDEAKTFTASYYYLRR